MKIRRAFSLIILVSVVLAATACSTQQSTASVAATVQTTETSTASEETSMSEQTTATTEQSIEAKAGTFDMVNKKVRLNSGYDMPIMGLGTYSLDYDTCVNSVKALLGNGGRLIDTAYMYGNEDAVGEGVRQAMEEYNIPREEIFVITKIYPSQYNEPEEAIDMALEKLDIGYIDMMLLHHPGTGDVDAYKAMEKYELRERSTLWDFQTGM